MSEISRIIFVWEKDFGAYGPPGRSKIDQRELFRRVQGISIEKNFWLKFKSKMAKFSG